MSQKTIFSTSDSNAIDKRKYFRVATRDINKKITFGLGILVYFDVGMEDLRSLSKVY